MLRWNMRPGVTGVLEWECDETMRLLSYSGRRTCARIHTILRHMWLDGWRHKGNFNIFTSKHAFKWGFFLSWLANRFPRAHNTKQFSFLPVKKASVMQKLLNEGRQKRTKKKYGENNFLFWQKKIYPFSFLHCSVDAVVVGRRSWPLFLSHFHHTLAASEPAQNTHRLRSTSLYSRGRVACISNFLTFAHIVYFPIFGWRAWLPFRTTQHCHSTGVCSASTPFPSLPYLKIASVPTFAVDVFSSRFIFILKLKHLL